MRVSLLVLALAGTLPATAAVVVERPLAPPPPTMGNEPYLQVVRPLRFEGKPTPAAWAPKLAGQERDVALGQALRKLVPSGWKGFVADPRVADLNAVSWKGGDRQWVLVLEEFLMQYGLVATLDWDAREITVAPGPNFKAPKD